MATSGSASRLMREERDVASQSIPVVWAAPDEQDILHWHAMILGPPSTPYCLGMFHFDMKFPADYPNSAPKVLIMTTSGGHVRFNPNLYATGKVCLSILGTWRAEHSGEQWSAVQSVQSVLLSIQSLMHDAPYHNEPTFEQDDGSGDVQRCARRGASPPFPALVSLLFRSPPGSVLTVRSRRSASQLQREDRARDDSGGGVRGHGGHPREEARLRQRRLTHLCRRAQAGAPRAPSVGRVCVQRSRPAGVASGAGAARMA